MRKVRAGIAVLLAVLLVAGIAGAVAGFPAVHVAKRQGVAVDWSNQAVTANGTLTYRSAAASNRSVVAPLGSNVHDCALVDINGTGHTRWRHFITYRGPWCRAQFIATPLVSTIHGRPTVLVAMKNTFYGFDEATGNVVLKKHLANMGFTAPVVVHSNDPLIVYPTMNGTVYAFHPNGTTAWKHHLGSYATGEQPQVVRPTSDGPPVVVVGGAKNIVGYDPNGSVAWRRNVSGRFLRAGHVDGRPIVVAASEYHVTGLYANGTVAWRHPTNESMTVGAVGAPHPGAPALAYVTDDSGSVLGLYASNGTVAWQRSLHSYRRYVPPPALGSLTGDGRQQVVVGAVNGRVRILDASTGAVMATYDRGVNLWTRPTILAGRDGHPDEAVLTYKDGRIVVLRYTGSSLPSWRVSLGRWSVTV